MENITKSIIRNLNESINQQGPRPNEKVAPIIQNEVTVGIDAPTKVYQCDNCKAFFGDGEDMPETCPVCGSTKGLKVFGNVVPSQKAVAAEEVKAEAEVIANEALRALSLGNFKLFNENYRCRTRINRIGELEAIYECDGNVGTASKKMTSRQKAAYKLSEQEIMDPEDTKSESDKEKELKNESVKLRRQNLIVRNESRAIKLQACRLLERQGVRYNFAKFNEGMDDFISQRDSEEKLKKVAEDDEIGKDDYNEMNPSDVADTVVDVIEDTGLSVVDNSVDMDGDTATVNIRVEDSPELEVHTSEIVNVLSEVFDKPIDVVGPSEAAGDKSLQDLAVIINPDAEPAEDANEDLDLEDDPEDDPKNNSENDVLEKFTKDTIGGDGPKLFALLSVDSPDNEPTYLANDDSMVSGNEDRAEDLARVFTSERAATKFLSEQNLKDKFEAVPITIISNEEIDDEDDPEEF